MKIQTKLIIGFGYCFFLVLVTSVSAGWGFSFLGLGIDRIMKENFESVSASMAMMDSLERQDSLTLARLIETDAQPGGMAKLEQNFVEALHRVQQNITIPGEAAIIEKVEAEYSRFKKSRDSLIARHPDHPLAAYQQGTLPAFTRVKQTVAELVAANRKAMHEADAEARRTVSVSSAWIGFLIVVALLSLALIYRWLHRDIISRLEELRLVAEASGDAPSSRRAVIRGSDELARIGRRLNHMLDRHQAFRTELEGTERFGRQLLLGLLRADPGARALLGLDGRIIATRRAGDLGSALQEIGARIAADGASLEAEARRADGKTSLPEQASLRLQLMCATEERPVGWLVRDATDDEPPADPAAQEA